MVDMRRLALLCFALSGCTWRIELVPPPVASSMVIDVAARSRLNNVYNCLPESERRCVDTKESVSVKREGE